MVYVYIYTHMYVHFFICIYVSRAVKVMHVHLVVWRRPSDALLAATDYPAAGLTQTFYVLPQAHFLASRFSPMVSATNGSVVSMKPCILKRLRCRPRL